MSRRYAPSCYGGVMAQLQHVGNHSGVFPGWGRQMQPGMPSDGAACCNAVWLVGSNALCSCLLHPQWPCHSAVTKSCWAGLSSGLVLAPCAGSVVSLRPLEVHVPIMLVVEQHERDSPAQLLCYGCGCLPMGNCAHKSCCVTRTR